MKKIICLYLCLVSIGQLAWSQTTENRCPPSSRNDIHIVQRGESLSIIAKQHNMTVEELCKLNGLQPEAVLRHCVVLKLTEGADVNAAEIKPSKKKEREKIVEYEMQLPKRDSTSKAKVVVKPKITKVDTLPFVSYEKQEGKTHIVQKGQTMANLSRLYGYREERFRAFNNLLKGEPKAGDKLLSTDCTCDAVTPPAVADIADNTTTEENATNTSSVKESEEVKSDDISPSEVTKKEEQPQEVPVSDTPTPIQNSNEYEGFAVIEIPTMTEEELSMVAEINLLRADPKAYIKYVDEYLVGLETNGQKKSSIEKNAKALIKQLKKTPKMQALEAKDCLYETTRKHAQEAIESGKMSHQGKDGSWPWDRARSNCRTLKDANENMVNGYESPRQAIIYLLIDDGIEGAIHRQILLNPEWRYVSCLKIATLGNLNNCWIQDFAF